jgi:hypothetical protein
VGLPVIEIPTPAALHGDLSRLGRFVHEARANSHVAGHSACGVLDRLVKESHEELIGFFLSGHFWPQLHEESEITIVS